MASDTRDLRALPLDQLSATCAEATAQRRDDGSCYELLRRAIAERQDAAWAAVYTQYDKLVRAWVVRHPTFATLPQPDADAEGLANAIFVRFWQSVTADRFADFPSTAALLGFLRRCANSVVLEAARRAGRRLRREERLDDHIHALAAPEIPDLDDELRMQLWLLARLAAQDEGDLVLLELSYRNDLKPAAIAARRPDLFPTVQDVYKCKRNLLDRLRRNPAVLDLVRDV